MKLFLIEAYGAPQGTDGHIRHFTVRADSLDEAIAMAHETPTGAECTHFDLIEESEEVADAEPEIVEAGDGPYLERG